MDNDLRTEEEYLEDLRIECIRAVDKVFKKSDTKENIVIVRLDDLATEKDLLLLSEHINNLAEHLLKEKLLEVNYEVR